MFSKSLIICRKHQVKQNIVWNDNDTVTYQIQDQYKYFIPELSNGNLTDRVTNLNVITMVSKLINLVSYRYYINVVWKKIIDFRVQE